MSKLAKLMQDYVDKNSLNNFEGVTKTSIEGIYFYRSSKGNKRQPFVYQSGVIVLGQGHKDIYVNGKPMSYGGGDYLIVGVPMPLECEAYAKPGEPLLGISINIPKAELQKVVLKLKSNGYKPVSDLRDGQLGMGSVHMEQSMLDLFQRLMKALCDDVEAEILGGALLTEIVYRALLSPAGHVLFELAEQEGQYARIASVLEEIHRHYSNPLTVNTLASKANMSVSAFHNAFRSVTLESPIQYIKKVRLNKARDLLQHEGKRVNDAARLVGYTSASQFSREFKRHFNKPPKALVLQV